MKLKHIIVTLIADTPTLQNYNKPASYDTLMDDDCLEQLVHSLSSGKH